MQLITTVFSTTVFSRSGLWRTNFAQLMRITAYALVFGAPLSTIAQSQPGLRIASWDLSRAEKSIFAPPPKPAKSSWRHTFGSERSDRKKSRIGYFNLEADVVLLQGVRNVRALKRVFPPRRWRLILSRDYTKLAPALSRLPADLQDYDIAATEYTTPHPVTAIAIRYQRRLRVRGVQHIPVATQADSPENRSHMASGTAVRINHYGSSIWLVSLARAQDCSAAISECAPWQAALQWTHSLGLPATTLIIAGTSKPAPSSPQQTPTEACGDLLRVTNGKASSALESPSKSLSSLVLPTQRRARKKLGCIVSATLDLEPAPRLPTSNP